MHTPAFMLCTTGNRPTYFEVLPCLKRELLIDGLPSHGLDAPAFAPSGGCYKRNGTPLHGVALYAGRVA